MNPLQTKVCEICHAVFVPDPRVGERQRVCPQLGCQRERQRRAQLRWLAKNPEAFHGRYPNLQHWLEAHPGYLKNYRACKKSSARASRRDIQDELTGNNDKRLITVHHLLDIQDEITSKITVCKRHLKHLGMVIYKTSERQYSQTLNGS